jgi:hypothetical protein
MNPPMGWVYRGMTLQTGFFSGEDEDVINKFKGHASSMRDDFRFGYTTDAAVLEEYGYKE